MTNEGSKRDRNRKIGLDFNSAEDHREDLRYQQGIPKATKGFLTHVNEAVGFSISYPETWKKMPESGDFLVGFEAPEIEYGDHASCIVAHDELSTTESLQSYFAKTKRDLQRQFKDYTPISEEELTIDQMPAIRHVYTASDKKMTLKLMQIYLNQGKVGLVVSFTSIHDAFESYQPTFETIANSFHLFGASRGEKATFVPSAVAMKRDIRGWGIGLIILGIIQIAVSFLNTAWGVILIAIGITDLFIPRREMYIANGIAIIVAGIINMFATVTAGGRAGGFAVLQFIWGANEIRKFFKYRYVTVRAPAKVPKVKVVHGTNRPKVAGILSIIAGTIMGIMGIQMIYSSYITIVTGTIPEALGEEFILAVIIWTVVFLIIALVAILGGFQAYKRQRWRLSLIGAICSLVCFFPLGIPAIILLLISKDEFEQGLNDFKEE